MKKKTIRLGDLVIDPKLTEIRHINPIVVSRYRIAYRNGANMPYIIIDEATKRVVSGNHRTKAMLLEYGEDMPVTVEVRTYKSEAELLTDFAVENSKHGQPMDIFTKRKLSLAMIDAGVTADQIAQIFNVSVKAVVDMGEGVIRVDIGGEIVERIAKTGLGPQETPLTSEQYEIHSRQDRGIPITSQAGQLTRWLANGFVHPTTHNIAALEALFEALQKFLEKHKVEA